MRRKIIGVTVGTTRPKANWNQTDPKKGDYIRNKPTISTGYDEAKITLSDRKTGKRYDLFISNGKLTMQESEE